jgi:hypothetical protein
MQESSPIMYDRVHEIDKARNASSVARNSSSVPTMLGKGCGEPLRSRITLGKAKAAK